MTEWTEQTRQTCREALITKRTLSAEMADIMQRAAEVVPQDDRAIAVESYTKYVNEVAAIDSALSAIDAPQPPVQHIPDDVAACIELLLDNTTMDELTKTTVRIWMMRAEMNAPQPQPVALDMPDGSGYWAFEGRRRFYNGDLSDLMQDVVNVVNTSFGMYGYGSRIYPAIQDGDYVGKWTRLYMPWEQSPAQPPMPDDVREAIRNALTQRKHDLSIELEVDDPARYAELTAPYDKAFAWLDAHSAQEGTK